jgi:hypothetical protein
MSERRAFGRAARPKRSARFTSKGGDQPLDTRVQPPTRSSENRRAQQATQVNSFVKQLLAVQPSARVVVLGDLNDLQTPKNHWAAMPVTW